MPSSSCRAPSLSPGMARNICRAAKSTDSSCASSSAEGDSASCNNLAGPPAASPPKMSRGGGAASPGAAGPVDKSARIAPMSSSCAAEAHTGAPPLAAVTGESDEAAARAGMIARVRPTKERATSRGSEGHWTAGSRESWRMERRT
eukprot:scaffold2706_cov109-Isochrysis_galbana.AAC.14